MCSGVPALRRGEPAGRGAGATARTEDCAAPGAGSGPSGSKEPPKIKGKLLHCTLWLQGSRTPVKDNIARYFFWLETFAWDREYQIRIQFF